MISHGASPFTIEQGSPRLATTVKLPFHKEMFLGDYQIVNCPIHLREPRWCTLEDRNNRYSSPFGTRFGYANPRSKTYKRQFVSLQRLLRFLNGWEIGVLWQTKNIPKIAITSIGHCQGDQKSTDETIDRGTILRQHAIRLGSCLA